MKSSLLPCLLLATALRLGAEPPAPPKPPIVNDTALRIELVASYPDVEACTTVCGAPDGSIYVGNDPRDGRLSNKEPVNTIVRLGPYESPDLIANPDGKLAPPVFHRKRTVFAEKIYSPAGSAWHDGYLYVLHDPLLTRFKDTDGDGVADVREDLITNLGIPPNEGLNDHVVSGFTLGMDGFFYISVGDRGIFEAKSVKDGSTITLRGGGIVRCRTDGTQLEIFSTGTRNHLSVNLDAEDNAFTRDNTDDGNGWWTRVTHHIQGGYYGYPFDFRKAPNYGVVEPSMETLNAIKQHGGTVDHTATMSDGRKVADVAAAPSEIVGQAPRLPGGNGAGEAPALQSPAARFLPAMADFGGGSPTGGLCYLSDGLPEQYRGRHFFSEWGKAGVFVTEVARDGATFKLVSDTKLIEPEKGADFRPMQLSVAADGSLLIADWGYGGWKSPRVAGAIWRLSWPEAKIAPRLKDESKATVEELLAALGHPDRDQRLRAQSALVGRAMAEMLPLVPGSEWKDATIIQPIISALSDPKSGTLGRMHALWVLAELRRQEMREIEKQKIGRGNGSIGLRDAASHLGSDADPIIRAQVARALGSVFFGDAASLIKDPESFVRLQATIGVARIGYFTPEYLARLSDSDLWIRFAAVAGLRFRLPEGTPRAGWADSESSAEVATTALSSSDPRLQEAGWRILPPALDEMQLRGCERSIAPAFSLESLGLTTQELLKPLLTSLEATTRTRAVAALGHIAYQPVPYDGHWWGTQPVKSPPPLNSVPWAGTPQALAALTVALSDPDTGVRNAAAMAFSHFILNDSAPEGPAMEKNAQPTGATPIPRVKGVDKTSQEGPPTASGTPPTASATPPTASGTSPTASGTASTASATPPTTSASPPTASGTPPTGFPASPTASDSKNSPSAPSRSLWDAVQASRAALRGRLTAEPDRGVRRQLIESLGVQKDPQAMDVFLKIALDEKADAEFRDTAIGAVVNIGGDSAKKVIAQLADAKLSPAATRQIITAAGELKVMAAAPALIARLQDADAGNREAAAHSLQQLGPKSGAGPALITLLADKDGKTQAAAIDALGSFREKAALPALIALAEKKRSMKETIGALANMPDESAIPVLVGTLRDKNTSVRRNAIKALKAMRDHAWPQVETLLASGRVPEELVPEIKNAFESGAITKWKMVGVFENVWDAQHPPEKEALANGGAANLSTKYHNAEGNDVGWIDVTADATEGRVDLEKVFHTSAMVCAYAFTEIDAPEAADAKLFTSADDEIAVWLDGRQVLNLSGSHGYTPDANETAIALHAGKNRLFVKIGNKSGSWVFHARIPGCENGQFIKSKEPAPDEKQRLFALAMKPDGSYANRGDAKNGEKIFFDQTGPLGGICATCHAVKGKGGQVGPDLSAIAANYKRPDLITSIHEPSKTIALGFEQFIVETKGGETFAGAIREDTADALKIVGADAQPHVVKKADVKAKTAVPVSIMPQGLTLGLKPQDFTDLLAFLETLNGK